MFLVSACVALAGAEVIDRIAVSVGNAVITASDLDREIRVTAFLNGVKPEFSSAAKRATADRMVEQKLVRRELELSRFPAPDASAVEAEWNEFRKQRYPEGSALERALAEYGITEQGVKDALLWQLTLLRFIEIRFRPGVQVSDSDIEEYFEKDVRPAAEASRPSQSSSLEDYRDRIRETLTGQRADVELDNWLKEVRQRTEIVFHEEVFQ